MMGESCMLNSNPLFNQQSAENPGNSSKPNLSIQQAQESLYSFLLESVKQHPPQVVLQIFENLFIQPTKSVKTELLQALQVLIHCPEEAEFFNAVKRSCFILLNNWKISNKIECIQELIELFENPNLGQYSASPTINRLRLRLTNFVKSKDYEELKTFATKCHLQKKVPWNNSYNSHLLAAESNNNNKTLAQRKAAREQANQLQCRFKFDLAMYMSRSQFPGANKQYKNPTNLPDEVLRLIKILVAKRDPASYINTANTFIKQTKNITYQQFKQRLEKYLLYAAEGQGLADVYKVSVAKKLAGLHDTFNDKPLNEALVFRTCNRLIEYLMTENHRQPSPIFTSLISQGNPMGLILVLLKVVLICKQSRNHLETCVAEIIGYYENASEKECSALTKFLDMFNIIFAIYADNIAVKLD